MIGTEFCVVFESYAADFEVFSVDTTKEAVSHLPVEKLLADKTFREKASSIGATLRATGGASSAAIEILAVVNQ